MALLAHLTSLSRRDRLLGPVALMTLGSLGLFVALAILLIHRFDSTASARERAMVEQGFNRQIGQYEDLVAPQAVWDKSIRHLDHRFDPDFADRNFGEQLFTFNGFTRSFFVDGRDRPIYASVNGKLAPLERVTPYLPAIRQLLVSIRAAEHRRGRVHPRTTGTSTITPSITAHGVVRGEGQVFIVIAALIQSDTGRVQPRGPHAPVAIMLIPIDQHLLNSFAQRYLVDDLHLAANDPTDTEHARFTLRCPRGEPLIALAWTPRRPGSTLVRQMTVPIVTGLLLLCLAASVIVRRSSAMVDELIASEARATELAYQDTLTRLPNRAHAFARLPALLGAASPAHPVAVLAIDLDRFKEVNDTLGHHAGDALISAVGRALRASLPPAALIARIGGDEFIVGCPVRTPAEARTLAESCLAAIVAPVESRFGRIEVGCSIGLSLVESPDTTAGDALRQADIALYRAKARGRACIVAFEPAMAEAIAERHALETALREALTEGSFHIAYQPQVDEAGQRTGVEALLRWNHPQLGPIGPATFIPVAEECGLVVPIGDFVLARVFAETRDWGDCRVAINISPMQLRVPGFAARVTQLAAGNGIDPARYDLELTETALLADTAATQENLTVLRRLGFGLVLDDFGTGYSSLSLLGRVPVDKVKIDRSFVAELGRSDAAEALVCAIVQLARTFGIDIVAEGVETEAQPRRLIEAGCRHFQGFLTGRPIPAAELVALADANARAA
ncbi:MAG: EAL domain-containing protein [Sphingomonadales bacterium]|nr:EAL domain-containing protein [Sphingomonadales bacterium]